MPSDFRNAEIAVLAAALIDGTREARSELGEVTPEELSFCARPGGHSAGAVLLHHAAVEGFWISCDLFREPEAFIGARFPEFPPNWHQGGNWPHLSGLTAGEIYRRSDEIRRETISRLATLDDPLFLTPSGDTARWVVNHLIGHEAYHFGQAVLLIDLARAGS